jgi:hypothetical protein
MTIEVGQTYWGGRYRWIKHGCTFTTCTVIERVGEFNGEDVYAVDTESTSERQRTGIEFYCAGSLNDLVPCDVETLTREAIVRQTEYDKQVEEH